MIAFLVPMIALWLFRRGLHGMTESKSRLFCFGRLPVSPKKKKQNKQTNRKQRNTDLIMNILRIPAHLFVCENTRPGLIDF